MSHSRTITFENRVAGVPTRTLRLSNPDLVPTDLVPTAEIVELTPQEARHLMQQSQIDERELPPRISQWNRLKMWFRSNQRGISLSVGFTVLVVGLIGASVAAPPVAILLVGCVLFAVVGGAISFDFLKRREATSQHGDLVYAESADV